MRGEREREKKKRERERAHAGPEGESLAVVMEISNTRLGRNYHTTPSEEACFPAAARSAQRRRSVEKGFFSGDSVAELKAVGLCFR